MAVPTKDSLLVPYASNFAPIVAAAPSTYGTTAAACTQLTTAVTNYVTAYNASRADGTKSKGLTAAKAAAKAALLPLIRAMYAEISANGAVSDQQKVDLGIEVRKAPSKQPPPNAAPIASVVSVNGRKVRMRLRDASNAHRTGKPVGVTSANILSFVGPTPPAGVSGWTMEGSVTKTVVDVTFPDSVAPGSLVWFTCYWLNAKCEAGPACDPISTYLQFGSVTMTA